MWKKPQEFLEFQKQFLKVEISISYLSDYKAKANWYMHLVYFLNFIFEYFTFRMLLNWINDIF